MKSWLQTTPHKQKGNTARNKNHIHLSQADVSKPVATPVPPDVEMSPRKPKNNHVDADIVDLVQKFSKEEKEQEALMKTEINDAVHKWCSVSCSSSSENSVRCFQVQIPNLVNYLLSCCCL